MIKLKCTFFTVLAVFARLTSFAQSGADPAVTATNIFPQPVIGGAGAPLSITFTVGNVGTVPISGANNLNRMGFGFCFSKTAASTPNPVNAVSGDVLQFYDITYNTSTGCIDARQKLGVPIDAFQLNDFVISLVVTTPSTTTLVNDIGGSLNISPSVTSLPQASDNDFASIYTHTEMTPQPVSLVSFTAQAQADRTVLLNWKTSWESANKGYVIERSKDLKSFEQVGEVTDVAGTSNSINSYKYVDKNPYRGTSYYRLVQLDLDGSRHTYKAEPVVIDGRYGVYPNPVSGHSFTLDLDEPVSAVLHLYDVSGREVSVSKLEVTELSTKVSPSVQLSTGVYVLTVEERGTLRKHRLVVQ